MENLSYKSDILGVVGAGVIVVKFRVTLVLFSNLQNISKKPNFKGKFLLSMLSENLPPGETVGQLTEKLEKTSEKIGK